MTRIAIIADIHHGPPSLTKRGDSALRLLEGFDRFVRDSAPDLVLDLGDRITDVDPETDRRLEAEVAGVLAALPVPVHHICGNHDRDHLSVAENEAILGQSLASEVVDLGGWSLALWRAEARIAGAPGVRGFDLPADDLAWLDRAAGSGEGPLLVASHVPVSGHAQTGNFYFQRNPHLSTYPQADAARAALSRAARPIVCLAGHVHWNTVTQVDGIPHLTQQSLTESFTTGGEPAAAWGLLDLGRPVRWRVFGQDPFEAVLTPSAQRWRAPMPPFGEAHDRAS